MKSVDFSLLHFISKCNRLSNYLLSLIVHPSIHPSIYSTNVYDMPAMYQVPCQVLETKQIKHLICWNLQSSEEQIEHLHDYM